MYFRVFYLNTSNVLLISTHILDRLRCKIRQVFFICSLSSLPFHETESSIVIDVNRTGNHVGDFQQIAFKLSVVCRSEPRLVELSCAMQRLTVRSMPVDTGWCLLYPKLYWMIWFPFENEWPWDQFSYRITWNSCNTIFFRVCLFPQFDLRHRSLRFLFLFWPGTDKSNSHALGALVECCLRSSR